MRDLGLGARALIAMVRVGQALQVLARDQDMPACDRWRVKAKSPPDVLHNGAISPRARGSTFPWRLMRSALGGQPNWAR
jgi:hypothetical protein